MSIELITSLSLSDSFVTNINRNFSCKKTLHVKSGRIGSRNYVGVDTVGVSVSTWPIKYKFNIATMSLMLVATVFTNHALSTSCS